MSKHKKKAFSKNVKTHTPISQEVELVSTPESLLLWEKLVIVFSFISIFFLYLYTLAPEVPTGDSGELITAAYLLGIPHPPGYPLFMMLGKLFSFIPIGSIAWRINLLSAVCNFSAAFLIYLTLWKLIKYWPAAILGAVFFALSPIVWEYSLKAEVFALNNLFAALIIYLIVILREADIAYNTTQNVSTKRTKYNTIYLLFFIGGLALTNHHTIILFAPGVIIALFFYGQDFLFKSTTILKALSFFFVGLLFYLYVPIRAHAQPYINWDDAQTWQGFIQLITRADYGTFKSMNVNGETYGLFEKWGLYLSSLFRQFNPLGIIFALAGIFYLSKQKEKKIGLILILTYLFSSFIFFTMTNLAKNELLFVGVFERFFMLPAVLLALFIGLGIYFVHQKTHQKIIFYGIMTITILSLLITIMLNFPNVNQRNNTLDYNYGRNIFRTLEKNALILMSGDVINNSLIYLQQVEGLRTDVIILSPDFLTYFWYCHQMQAQYPSLTIPFKRYAYNTPQQIVKLVDANINERPIYSNSSGPFIDSSYRLMAIGLVRKVVKADFWPPKENYIKINQAFWHSYDLTGLTYSYPEMSFEKEIIKSYAWAHFYLGWDYHQMGLYDLALVEYNKAIRIDPSLPDPYKNAGIIYANIKNQPNKAVPYFKVYVHLNPTDKDNKAILSMFPSRFLIKSLDR